MKKNISQFLNIFQLKYIKFNNLKVQILTFLFRWTLRRLMCTKKKKEEKREKIREERTDSEEKKEKRNIMENEKRVKGESISNSYFVYLKV